MGLTLTAWTHLPKPYLVSSSDGNPFGATSSNATYFTKLLENCFGSHFMGTSVSQVKGQNEYIFSF